MNTLFSIIVFYAGLVAGPAPQNALAPTASEPSAAKETVVLQRVALPESDREMGMGIADFPPNTAKPRQKALGPEICYVVEGEVTVEVEGQPTKSYHKGESFEFSAMVVHQTTAGPEGAKVLATWVHTPGDQFNIPAPLPQAKAEINPDWTTPLPPFRIADNLYYVGSQDLASYLIVTPKGDILINANLASSPPQIRASVEKLGFHWTDIKILLNGQAHADHMGGAAEVVQETHARNMVMDGDVSVVETGAKTDFLAPSPDIPPYTPVHVDRVLHDEDTVSLGGVTLTAHKTAGHTRGCTTWSLRSHLPGEPAGSTRQIVIVGGTGFWSAYHFVAIPGHPVSYPGIAQDFQHTFAVLHALPCDVFLGAHGGYFDMLTKLERYPQDGPRVFIDPAGYKDFVADAQKNFEEALAKQQSIAVQ